MTTTHHDMKRQARALYSRERVLPPGVHAVPAVGAEDLAPYGVTLGRRVHQARRFRHVTLPEGWRYVDSDHAATGWSAIVDQFDRTRAVIWWTADYYRGWVPQLIVSTARSYALQVVEHGGPLIVDDRWATREKLLKTVDERVTTFEYLVKTDEATLTRCDEFHPIGGTGIDEWDQDGTREWIRARAAEDLVARRAKLARWEQARSQFENAPVMPHTLGDDIHAVAAAAGKDTKR